MKRFVCLTLALVLLWLCGCGERLPAGDLSRPVTAEYAESGAIADHTAVWEESEYTCYVLLTAADNVRNVRLAMLDFTDTMDYTLGTVFFEAAEMQIGETLLAGVVYYGDMTTYGISFTDSSGAERSYAFFMSGKDGSLILLEY